jgi:RNA polymerase sigma-70 factor (ECF subfamily)
MAFPTTRWTLLAEATLHGDAAGRAALGQLCEQYRRPVVVYLEGRGLRREEAQDAAQDFLLKLVESGAWKRADQARGRFRTFLLAILNHTMMQAARNAHREKRGGGMPLESLDALAEQGCELADGAVPDAALFDREWAFTLVAETVAAVETEFAGRGQQREFALLRCFLPGPGAPPSYDDAARELGLSDSALKAAVHRLRQRFREVLRAAVARTVSAPHEVDEELRYLGTLLMKDGEPPRNFASPTGNM